MEHTAPRSSPRTPLPAVCGALPHQGHGWIAQLGQAALFFAAKPLARQEAEIFPCLSPPPSSNKQTNKKQKNPRVPFKNKKSNNNEKLGLARGALGAPDEPQAAGQARCCRRARRRRRREEERRRAAELLYAALRCAPLGEVSPPPPPPNPSPPAQRGSSLLTAAPGAPPGPRRRHGGPAE